MAVEFSLQSANLETDVNGIVRGTLLGSGPFIDPPAGGYAPRDGADHHYDVPRSALPSGTCWVTQADLHAYEALPSDSGSFELWVENANDEYQRLCRFYDRNLGGTQNIPGIGIPIRDADKLVIKMNAIGGGTRLYSFSIQFSQYPTP